MRKKINFQEFKDEFMKEDLNIFTDDGYVALFEYLEDWEHENNRQYDLCVYNVSHFYKEYYTENILKSYHFENVEDLKVNFQTVIKVNEDYVICCDVNEWS